MSLNSSRVAYYFLQDLRTNDVKAVIFIKNRLYISADYLPVGKWILHVSQLLMIQNRESRINKHRIGKKKLPNVSVFQKVMQQHCRNKFGQESKFKSILNQLVVQK